MLENINNFLSYEDSALLKVATLQRWWDSNQRLFGHKSGALPSCSSPLKALIKNITLCELYHLMAGPQSAVCNVSGYRCVSDCRSRGSIPTQSHTFIEIDHEIVSMVNLFSYAE